MRNRPQPIMGPQPWSPYLLHGMTPEEAAPLLWVPQVIHNVPRTMPRMPCKYGVAMRLGAETTEFLGTQCAWLLLTWYIQGEHTTPWGCDVRLNGIDDTHYGARLRGRNHVQFVDTWQALLSLVEDCGARELGLNGESLLEYCEASLGTYERYYN